MYAQNLGNITIINAIQGMGSESLRQCTWELQLSEFQNTQHKLNVALQQASHKQTCSTHHQKYHRDDEALKSDHKTSILTCIWCCSSLWQRDNDDSSLHKPLVITITIYYNYNSSRLAPMLRVPEIRLRSWPLSQGFVMSLPLPLLPPPRSSLFWKRSVSCIFIAQNRKQNQLGTNMNKQWCPGSSWICWGRPS